MSIAMASRCVSRMVHAGGPPRRTGRPQALRHSSTRDVPRAGRPGCGALAVGPPNGSTKKHSSDRSGMRERRWFVRTRTSDRFRPTIDASSRPSSAPCGWFDATSKGPRTGTTPSSRSDIRVSTSSAFNARHSKGTSRLDWVRWYSARYVRSPSSQERRGRAAAIAAR